MDLPIVAHTCYIHSMVKPIKLRRMGGSIGATIPKDMAERFRLQEGDEVFAIETDQGILFSPFDPEVLEALGHAADAARRYRNALRELAK